MGQGEGLLVLFLAINPANMLRAFEKMVNAGTLNN